MTPIRACTRKIAVLGGTDQAVDRRLLFRKVLFGLRQRGDVVACILQRDELATARQRYRIIELL